MKRILFVLTSLILLGLVPVAGAEDRLTVFAAASMKDALEEAARVYENERGTKLVLSLASSSVLAKQIEAGAPADIFVSADREWMDWLGQRGLILAETRRDLAGNELVLAMSAGSKPVDDPRPVLDHRFAMGDPNHVPAGKYGKAALESLGLWKAVQPNAVYGENVRVALELVRKGEVGAAIIYGSDRSAAPELVKAYTFPRDSHPAIVYPGAVTASGARSAVDFLDFMIGAQGQAILAKHGFSPVEP